MTAKTQTLKELIAKIQLKYRLNDEHMGRLCGLDGSLIWRLRHGERRAGTGTLAKLIRTFPEYKDRFIEAVVK